MLGAHTAAVPAAPEPAPTGTDSLAGLRLLVVDDNETNRRILAQTVLGWGMLPSLASSAAEALILIEQATRSAQPFALLLVDVHMPEMDGFHLIEAMRSGQTRANPVVLMLTSGENRGDRARCQALGISTYLTKPVRRADLRTKIMEAIASPRAGRSLTAGGGPMAPRTDGISAPETIRSILLVEDNAVNQRLTLRILEKAGYRVTLAENGRIAVEAFDRGGIDLILMDVQMPEMDGFEATAEIRKREVRSGFHIPIIAMTAHAMSGDRERCLRAGMDNYITKPVGAQMLLRMIEESVAGRSLAAV